MLEAPTLPTEPPPLPNLEDLFVFCTLVLLRFRIGKSLDALYDYFVSPNFLLCAYWAQFVRTFKLL